MLRFLYFILYIIKNILHFIYNYLNFYNVETFINKLIIRDIQVKIYSRIKIFIYIKRIKFYDKRDIVIINKFNYRYLFDLIILYIIAIYL